MCSEHIRCVRVSAILHAMPIERCDECGFDSRTWTDHGAMDTAAELPRRWAQAIDGLTADELQRRPIDGTWSIAEYTDHVRETAFGMRFVLDTILIRPGTDLGDPPESRFEREPRPVDTARALSGFRTEITQLCERLAATPKDRWAATCTLGRKHVDVHWVVRHVVHETTHHLGDLDRLRDALDRAHGC